MPRRMWRTSAGLTNWRRRLSYIWCRKYEHRAGKEGWLLVQNDETLVIHAIWSRQTRASRGMIVGDPDVMSHIWAQVDAGSRMHTRAARLIVRSQMERE